MDKGLEKLIDQITDVRKTEQEGEEDNQKNYEFIDLLKAIAESDDITDEDK